MDATVDLYMSTTLAFENTPNDPEKGSEEVFLEHSEEPSNSSSQGAVTE
jgi:hypothetical protein